LNLKKAAMEQLWTDDYLAFLGATPSSSRVETFQRLAPSMDREAADYWKQHQKMVEKGVLYQGVVEKRLKLAKIAFFFRRWEIRSLFACKTLDQQRQFLKKNWSHNHWKFIFKWALKPCLSRLTLQDPGMYEYVTKDFEPG